MSKAIVRFVLIMNGIWACPYCATSDTLGSGLSAYVPLVGIIVSPFIMVFGVVMYIRKKDHNNDFE